MNTFYKKRQKAINAGLPIVYETVESYLARGGKINVFETGTFDYSKYEEMQRKIWCNKNHIKLGNGCLQKRESYDRIDEIL